MTKIIWHKHHIIPKHMGGTDEKNNLIKVNIAMHAFLHKLLWEEHGKWQDEIAWKCLSGQIINSEINIQIIKAANYGRIPPNKGKPSPLRGKKRPEHSEFLSKGQPWKKRKYEITHPDGETEEIVGLIDFCKKHKINASGLSQVSRGKKEHANGFKCKRII